MKFYQQIQDAYASLRHVTDQVASATFRKPLEDFRRECPFTEFHDDTGQDVSFQFRDAGSAHVLTRAVSPETTFAHAQQGPVVSKDSYQFRQIKLGPGRDTFTVPAKRIQVSVTIPMLNPFFRSENQLKGVSDDTPGHLGLHLVEMVESHAIAALDSAACASEGAVIRTTAGGLQEMVQATIAILGHSSIIAGAKSTSALLRGSNEFQYERLHFGGRGRIHLTGRIAENIVIAVANKPKEVVNVRIRFGPDLFVTTKDGTDIVALGACELGFFVRENVEVRKYIVCDD